MFYGFTTATEQEYLSSQNRDVPWQNTFGEFKEEGEIDITQQNHHPVNQNKGKQKLKRELFLEIS